MSTGDGILAALKITEFLCNQNIKASKLFDLYEDYPQIKKNISINKKISKKKNEKINELYLNYKIKYKKLRFLIRKSGTEPIIRVLVEGEEETFVTKVFSKLIEDLENILNEK